MESGLPSEKIQTMDTDMDMPTHPTDEQQVKAAALRSLGLPEDIGEAMREAPKKQGFGRYPPKKRVEPVKKSTDKTDPLTGRHKQDSSLIRKPGDDAKWDAQYKLLVEYNLLHGNCNVPRSTTLGNWVSTQRSAMSNKNRNLNTTMTTDREEKLNNIGFRWIRYHDAMTEEEMVDLLDGAAGSASHHLAPMPEAWQMDMADLLDGAAGSATLIGTHDNLDVAASLLADLDGAAGSDTHHLAPMPEMDLPMPVASDMEMEMPMPVASEADIEMARLPIPEAEDALGFGWEPAAGSNSTESNMDTSERGGKKRIRISWKRKSKKKSKRKYKRKYKRKSKKKSKKKSKRKK
jgi:hypothetical protein